jgi:ubiquinone/menaquinone biosynthesis C-methylase UbiE
VSPRSKRDNEVGGTYRKGARRYDSAVRLFDLFRPFGLDLPAGREEAVRALDLERGDTVVDVGCGTGLNFPFLQEAIGPEGRIVCQYSHVTGPPMFGQAGPLTMRRWVNFRQ